MWPETSIPSNPQKEKQNQIHFPKTVVLPNPSFIRRYKRLGNRLVIWGKKRELQELMAITPSENTPERKTMRANIIIAIVGFLAVIWSCWYFSNYPQTYLAGDKVQKRCDELTNKTPYCVGYAAGHEWAVSQINYAN